MKYMIMESKRYCGKPRHLMAHRFTIRKVIAEGLTAPLDGAIKFLTESDALAELARLNSIA